MKKSVGIITMHKIYNFGSALQAYALMRVIENLGYDAELIDYQFPNTYHGVKKGNLIERIKNYIGRRIPLTPGFATLNAYDRFWKRFFRLSIPYTSPQMLKMNPPQYDVYVTGSDQVWNTDYTKDDSSFLLDFVKEGKRISYASSFSKNTIDNCYVDLFKSYLSRYDSLSVREKSGVEIIRNLAQKESSVVLDPTMLLTKEEWNRLADLEEDTYKGRKYIFLYIQKYSFDPTSSIVKLVKFIKEKLNLPIISFRNMEHVGLSCEVVDGIGPIQFLHLVRNASYIVTASFHGTAFAINYGIPFSSMIKSESYNDDRQMSLMSMFELSDRMVRMDENVTDLNLSVSFDRVNTLLSCLRQQSKEYLTNSIGK